MLLNAPGPCRSRRRSGFDAGRAIFAESKFLTPTLRHCLDIHCTFVHPMAHGITCGCPCATCAATHGTLLDHPPLFVPRVHFLLRHPPLFVPRNPFWQRRVRPPSAPCLATLHCLCQGRPLPFNGGRPRHTRRRYRHNPRARTRTPNPTTTLSRIPYPFYREGCGHPRHPAWPPSTVCARDALSLSVATLCTL